MSPTQDDDSITYPASPGFGEPIRLKLVDAVGDDGAWLLLSLDHYSWRASYDIAIALTNGASGASEHHARHVQSVVDLQVQTMMLAAVEQLARLLKAIASHEDGMDIFFDTYVAGYRSIPDLLTEISAYTSDDLLGFFAIPDDAAVVAANAWRRGSPIETDVAEAALSQVESIVAEMATNLTEVMQLTERPDLSQTSAPVDQGHSLRNVDNAFRHGLKILMHDALPADRSFGVAVHREADPLSTFAVDLYQSATEPKFATIDGRPERTEAHVAAIEAICVRIKQASRAFIARLVGDPVLLITLPRINLDELDPSLID